jgi:L-rhamnose-H+ transport protein
MAEHFWVGAALIFLSGAMNGSFALPMKYAKTWRWENTWLIFAVVALLLSPWALACGFVPHFREVYRGIPIATLLLPLIFGLLWGIAQVTFGVGIAAVGMALAFAVVAGLSCLAGSLVPLVVLHPLEILSPRGVLLVVSIPILLVGLVLYGTSGRRREREQAPTAPVADSKAIGFKTGLGICIFTGIVGSSWNLGFAFSSGILARSTGLGAGSITSTYALWPLILTAGFVPNLLYCSYLLFRNGTWSMFGTSGSAKEALLGVGMGLLWLGGILGYGVGAGFVGRFGTSLGFALFTAGQILASNLLGIFTGEWKSTSPRTMALLKGAVVAILISVIVLNLGGLFSGHSQ